MSEEIKKAEAKKELEGVELDDDDLEGVTGGWKDIIKMIPIVGDVYSIGEGSFDAFKK